MMDNTPRYPLYVTNSVLRAMDRAWARGFALVHLDLVRAIISPNEHVVSTRIVPIHVPKYPFSPYKVGSYACDVTPKPVLPDTR